MEKALNAPSDIWWRIMAECRPSEIMVLAQCCRLFYELANSRVMWLKCVQSLGPYESPSIPKHVRPCSLTTSDLRSVAVNAHRRTLERESELPSKVVRETVISLKDANPNEVLGEPIEFGMQLFPLPGENYLLIYWPAGYLQCWSIRDGSCLWVYPDLPEGPSEDRPKLLWTFDFDMQESGNLHLLLVDERLQGEEMGSMSWEIVEFSPESSTVESLFHGTQLNKNYGLPITVRLRCGLTILYQKHWGLPLGTLTIFFREGSRTITVTDVNAECLEATDDFIICLSNVGNGNRSVNIILLSDVLRAARSVDNVHWTVSGVDVLSSAMLLESKSFSLRKPELTLNTLHWMIEADQDVIYITVLYKDRISKGSPFARFVLNRRKGTSEKAIWPLLSMYSLDNNDENIVPTLSGRTFAAYTILTPPTLSGRSLALLYTRDEFIDCEDKLALAILGPDGSIKFKPLEMGIEYRETRAICTEFYSGAVFFASRNYDSVMVRYFE